MFLKHLSELLFILINTSSFLHLSKLLLSLLTLLRFYTCLSYFLYLVTLLYFYICLGKLLLCKFQFTIFTVLTNSCQSVDYISFSDQCIFPNRSDQSKISKKKRQSLLCTLTLTSCSIGFISNASQVQL